MPPPGGVDDAIGGSGRFREALGQETRQGGPTVWISEDLLMKRTYEFCQTRSLTVSMIPSSWLAMALTASSSLVGMTAWGVRVHVSERARLLLRGIVLTR